MARSVAIVGAGQIGCAAADEFASEGWEVSLHARTRPGWLASDNARFVRYLAGEDTAPTADVVLDTIAYDDSDVARYDPEAVGRLIVVSSASVYRDDEGRTLDEAAKGGFPDFPNPITESQPTVAPGPETYSTRKVRMENRASALFGERVTILRPCAIYGPWSRHPREWWFVKRMLDGRRTIPLAFAGHSRFHTTSVGDIANFTREAGSLSWGGVYNIGADTAPTVAEIGAAIAEALGIAVDFLPIEGAPEETVGRTPWSLPKPFTISNAKARAAGDGLGEAFGVGIDYGGCPTAKAVEWLREFNPADWRAAFPPLAAYPWDLFDYSAEDRFFASR